MKLLPRFLRDIIREKKQKIRHKRRIAAFDKIIEAFLDSKTPGTLYALNHNNRIAGGGAMQNLKILIHNHKSSSYL